ncbi:hypothetical protein J3R03_006729 [Actinoplanes couchii]|nr:hypothetical protein [Actinoplanes couchii]
MPERLPMLTVQWNCGPLREDFASGGPAGSGAAW